MNSHSFIGFFRRPVKINKGEKLVPNTNPPAVQPEQKVTSILQTIEQFTIAGTQVISGNHPVIAQDVSVGLAIFDLVAQLVAQLRHHTGVAPANSSPTA